jgi:hypothetical protein
VAISREEILGEFKQNNAQSGGDMLGGGADPADKDAAGGSSGTGGYGNAQNQSNHQGQTGGPDSNSTKPVTRELSRGERYDMEQGGGRADDAVDFEAELAEDQQAHQDRGQGFIASEGEGDTGAVTEGQQP